MKGQRVFKGIALLFLLTALLYGISVLIISILADISYSVIDNVSRDTYFIIPNKSVYIFFFGYLVLVSSTYCFFNYFLNPLNKPLGLSHFIGTIPLIVLLLVATIQHAPRRYYSFNGAAETNSTFNLNSALTIFSMVFLGAQLLFVVNIFLTLLRKTK